MNKLVTSLTSLMLLCSISFSQKFVANYNESDIPPYTLPDPFTFEDGTRVDGKKDWNKRRDELFRIFSTEVYGVSPQWKGEILSTDLFVNPDALDGLATAREVKLTLKNKEKEHSFRMLLYLPKSKKPVPVFLGYNFNGNHTVTAEPQIALPMIWKQDPKDPGPFPATGDKRGRSESQWQAREIVSRGYGLATIYYCDVDPDYDDNFKNGVHSLYETERDSSSWATIAAWAWGLSRALDYLENVRSVDSKKVIVFGHSRLGKTALWAAAADKRFAMSISNNSGCGGAALSKRIYGETVGSINRGFTHWFCDNFDKYNENEEKLPVDQHQLLSIIAPRPVYVASAVEDQWADPKGEFLSCVAASPVYKMLGGEGFPATEMPSLNSPVHGSIGYHIRSGKHDVTLYDWQQYLDFADKHLKK